MCRQLVRLLTESIDRNHADALLLSGGLDSSILASMLRPQYSVAAGFGANAPDLAFARQIALKFSKRHAEVIFVEKKMFELADSVIQVFKTFDPTEIRNSSVALAGMERAKSDGYAKVMTGDGGDELFAGYNYLARYYHDMQKLDNELKRLWDIMHFSSAKLGEKIGLEVKAPFLDPGFASYARSIDVQEKVGDHGGRKWGKFILRRCFEPALGDMVWRPKMAQEQGAATDTFHNYVGRLTDDAEFGSGARNALEEGVRIRDKEHLHYYRVFRNYFPPPREECCELRCPQCRGCFRSSGRFCRICGAFPVTPISL